MEIKFQNPLDLSPPKPKSFRSKSGKKNKFLGVRQRPSGKWVAEIKNTTQKIRMWLGTFDTAEEAARAYDEAAYLLRGSNTRKNFADHCPSNSSISLKIKSLLNQKKASKQIQTSIPTNSPNKTIKKTSSQTSCLVLPSDFNREFNILSEELPENIFSFNPPKPVIETCTKTSSQASSLQSHSENASPATSGCSIQDFQIFDDDAYRPDLSQCLNEEENGIGSVQFGQAHGDELYQFLSQKEELLVPESDILVPKSDILVLEMSENRFPEFEKMKVERQISASLYAMNEVDEYWQNFNNPSDSLWDLQMVYQMFYSS